MAGEVTVQFPHCLNAETIYPFLDGSLAAAAMGAGTTLRLDFSTLRFIDPVGMVVLSNLIEYLARRGIEVSMAWHRIPTDATRYLDDCGFFERYEGQRLFGYSILRATTMPLQRVDGPRCIEYLYYRLMPWIARTVDQAPTTLDALRSSLEEILHNIRDHSGVDAGCTFAQHFPNEKQIRIAVSDFGEGIPNVVRRAVPEADDSQAMRLACQEGFTTGANGHNRGYGLHNLTRYVTQRLGGAVLIAAGSATLSATPREAGMTRLAARSARGLYPGTLVQVLLQTDKLRRAAVDVEPEEFTW